jgi:hypothetical protein
MNYTTGIHTDVTIEAYHADREYLSSTWIKLAKKSLKEFFWTREGKIFAPQKGHFDFGNAFELALMDQSGFAEKVAIRNDHQWINDVLAQRPDLDKVRASKEYKALNETFEQESTGKYVINDKGSESWETIQAMLESCYADKTIQGLIKNTECQLSLFWNDEQTGLKLKTRPDICKRNKNIVVNLKTTLDGSPKGFSKDLAKFDYPLQACLEMQGCIATGAMPKVDNYFWLVVEKVAPFNATIYEFDQQDMKAYEVELEWLIHKVKKAMDENMYPGYSDRADNKHGILKAEIPMYHKLAV